MIAGALLLSNAGSLTFLGCVQHKITIKQSEDDHQRNGALK